jgi:hypothetical protein
MFINNKNLIFCTTFKKLKNKNYPPINDNGTAEAIAAAPIDVPILEDNFASSSVG